MPGGEGQDPWGGSRAQAAGGLTASGLGGLQFPGQRESDTTPSLQFLFPPFRSFVVGSDGYMYEGRGWHWQGAHTYRHNSLGFGVAFVGNYTAALPTEAAMRSVRDEFPGCALRAGFLRPQYKVLGHRQLVSTDCPGDALFEELRTWPHFVSPHSAPKLSAACLTSTRLLTPILCPPKQGRAPGTLQPQLSPPPCPFPLCSKAYNIPPSACHPIPTLNLNARSADTSAS